jgi:hypothetical protein
LPGSKLIEQAKHLQLFVVRHSDCSG